MRVTIRTPRPVAPGELAFVCTGASGQAFGLAAEGLDVGKLSAGMLLGQAEDAPLWRVMELGHLPAPPVTSACGALHAMPGAWLQALAHIGQGTSAPLTAWKEGLSLAWITLSDKGAAGLREDKSGPAVETEVAARLALGFTRGYLLPDDEPALRALLTHLCLAQRFDLVITTGGTGLGPRDVAPEATLAVIEKRLPGFERAITAAGLAKTPHAMISRAVAGTLGPAVVLNLPGSAKAVAEGLEAALPAVAHAVEKLQGDQGDCGT